MAGRSTTERTVKTKFDGDASGGIRASRQMDRELKRLERENAKRQASFVSSVDRGSDRVISSLGKVTTGILGIGSAAGSVQGLAGATAAVATLSGTLLAAPGIAAAAGAGFGVLKFALAGFGDVLAAKDLEEFNELTKDMAPAAVEAAKAIREQNGRLVNLKRTVQDRFFAGFKDDVRDLSDTYFPILKEQSGAIAGEWNLMGRAAAKALLAPSAVNDVNEILASTKDTLHEMEPSLANVLRGLLGLGGVGARRASSLGKVINGLTKDFADWVDAGVESGKINKLIDEGIVTAKQFGQVISNVGGIGRTVWRGLSDGGADFLGGLIQTTQALEDFLNSAEGQQVLKELGQTLKVTADVARTIVATAFRELAPVVRDIAPAVREVVSAVGGFLVNALETVGPLLQSTARFLSENKEVVGELVPVILGLAVAYKGLQVANNVKTWVGSGLDALDSFTKKANNASDAIGDPKSGKGLAGRLGGLKAVAGVAAIAGAAVVLDELNTSAAGAEDQLNVTDDALHNVVGAAEQIGSLNFKGIFRELQDEWQQMIDFGNKAKNDAARARDSGIKIKVEADTFAAQLDLNKLMNSINKSSGTVNINGNDNPAAFALRRVLEEIKQGKETVTINGQSVPAQKALAQIIDQINLGTGTVDMNGNTVPAGQALTEVLRRIGASTADVSVGANVTAAQGVINSFIQRNDGRQIQIYTSVLGSGGIASAGRLAVGGAVRGRGTGTSDTAGLFALSNGEHVLTAAEVRMLGGQGSVYQLRRMIRSGGLTGLAEGGAAVPAFARPMTWPGRAPNINVSATASAPEIRVFIGEREITDVVRTEIGKSKKQDRRHAATGPGGAW